MDSNQYNSLLQHGFNLLNQFKREEAESVCQSLLVALPKDVKALVLKGCIHIAYGRGSQAIEIGRKVVKLKPRDVDAQHFLALAYLSVGQYASAIKRFDLVIRLDPNNQQAYSGKAEAYQRSGKYEKALDYLARFIDAGEETPEMGHVYAGSALELKRYELALEVASRNVSREDVNRKTKSQLYFVLGKAHERQKQYDEAFDAYRSANETELAVFSIDDHRQNLADIRNVFSAEAMPNFPRASEDDESLVFIIGMPRCGSTLVETIIDAHPQAYGGGELLLLPSLIREISLTIGSTLPWPQCINDLEPTDADELATRHLKAMRSLHRTARRIVDKHLKNYEFLGLIEVLFPKARIIHCRRDALDMCASCYMSPLVLPTNAYTYDLVTVGQVHREYERMMEHWRQVSSIEMLEVDYEDLISDPTRKVPEIIDFCGLPWNDACLRFHETGRHTLTVSMDQVRKPIYKTSVRRAERFGSHFQPLIDALEGRD